MFKGIERYSLLVGKGYYKSFQLMSVIRHLLFFCIVQMIVGSNWYEFGTKYIIHITVIINNSKRKEKKKKDPTKMII